LRTLHPLQVCALARLPRGCASSRYRLYQYVKPLKKYNIELHIYSTYPEWLYIRRKNTHSSSGNDFLTLFVSLFRMLVRIIPRLKNADLVFILRDAAPFSLMPLIKFVRSTKKPIIFDFDDAIYLRNKRRISMYISNAHLVFAGNHFLKKWALRINKNCVVIPSVIDLNRYNQKGSYERKRGNLSIGWIGSPGTSPYLRLLTPVLWDLSRQIPFEFRVIGGNTESISGICTRFLKWNETDEIRELSKLDIGVSPLPDNEYTRGKCGVKLLQYMAMGIPSVASPVGIHKDIIVDGWNGFLASNEKEWLQKLRCLIEKQDLRRIMGKNAKRTVAQGYSLDISVDKIANLIRNVYARRIQGLKW
jgi:glycosyltransferase involved in cell wall biosynthesis